MGQNSSKSKPKSKETNSKYSVSDATSRAVNLTLPRSIFSPLLLKPTRFEFDTKQANSRCFYLEDILTPEECDGIISKAQNMKFDVVDDIKYEYPTSYRNNQRMIIINPELSKSLWSRIQPFLTANDIFNVSPVGFLAKGYILDTTIFFLLEIIVV
jgi:hypothetical protein